MVANTRQQYGRHIGHGNGSPDIISQLCARMCFETEEAHFKNLFKLKGKT